MRRKTWSSLEAPETLRVQAFREMRVGGEGGIDVSGGEGGNIMGGEGGFGVFGGEGNPTLGGEGGINIAGGEGTPAIYGGEGGSMLLAEIRAAGGEGGGSPG
jgi:hypothetical protein